MCLLSLVGGAFRSLLVFGLAGVDSDGLEGCLLLLSRLAEICSEIRMSRYERSDAIYLVTQHGGPVNKRGASRRSLWLCHVQRNSGIGGPSL